MTCHRNAPPRRRFHIVTILLALAACLVGGSASAASLTVEGGFGTAVTIDGESLGTLPLDGPVEIPAGVHLVRAERRGFQPLDREILLEEGGSLRLQLRLVPLSRKDAITYSFLLAGAGQRYLGRDEFGWALTVLEIGGLLTALVSEAEYQNSRDDYLVAYDSYMNAVGNDEISHWRATADAAYADMEDAESLRNTALLAAGGAVLVSVLDSWLRFPGVEAGPGPVPPAGMAAAAAKPAGLHVCCSIPF